MEGSELEKLAEVKNREELSEAVDSNLSYEACIQRLAIVEEEKLEMESYVRRIASESRVRLEASLEELKEGLDSKLTELSSKLQDLYKFDKERNVTQRKSLRKIFEPQISLLSKMLFFDDENYRTIFNIMICVLVLWGVSIAYDDYQSIGLPNFDLLHWGVVRDFELFAKYWTIMFFASFSIVVVAHFAATASNVVSYYFILLVYTCMQLGMFAYSTAVIYSGVFPIAMPLAIGFMAEQARMSMKMHSYFREKVAWRRFNGEFACAPISAGMVPLLGCGNPEPPYLCRELEKFCYFMFVPTLVYRDSYPRSTRVRWLYVAFRLLEVAGIIYYAFLVFRQVLPQFHKMAGKPLTLDFFIRSTFNCMGPAMASMVFTHYLVLHNVQNIGAELTRFADRKFYEDWWNSRTFSVFYRKWNGVVHDWIHCYLYTDMVEFCRLPKGVSLLSSFLISAVVHEYLICVSMGFFLPILGVLFTGPGLIFILLTKNKTARIWNIFMWLMLSIGNASLMVLYCSEYYARSEGPELDPMTSRPWSELGYYDFFVPRIYRIQLTPSQ